MNARRFFGRFQDEFLRQVSELRVSLAFSWKILTQRQKHNTLPLKPTLHPNICLPKLRLNNGHRVCLALRLNLSDVPDPDSVTHSDVDGMRLLILVSSVATVVLASVAMVYHQTASVGVIKSQVIPNSDLASGEILPLDSEDVPSWKGRLSTGVYPCSNAPVNWTPESNVLWSAAINGKGHSSPIVRGSVVYLTTSDADTASVVAIDIMTGAVSWQHEVCRGTFPEKHDKNTNASSTPACDSRYLYAAFALIDGLWLSAIDQSGNVVWKTCVGPFRSEHGYGSSVAYSESTVFVLADNRGHRGSGLESLKTTSYLAAVNAQTGAIQWRIQRAQVNSYGTPVVAVLSGKRQLIVGGGFSITSYDPDSGEVLWSCKSNAERTASSPAFGDDLIFSSAVNPKQEILAVRTSQIGDVSAEGVVWRKAAGAADVCSPIWSDGLLYILSEGGVITCFNGANGRQLWKKRVAGKYSASPIIANSRLYLCSEDGKITVLSTGEDPEVLAENSLDEAIFASPVFSRGKMFIRTEKKLWCIAEDAQSAESF